jgi:hypothetical protein
MDPRTELSPAPGIASLRAVSPPYWHCNGLQRVALEAIVELIRQLGEDRELDRRQARLSALDTSSSPKPLRERYGKLRRRESVPIALLTARINAQLVHRRLQPLSSVDAEELMAGLEAQGWVMREGSQTIRPTRLGYRTCGRTATTRICSRLPGTRNVVPWKAANLLIEILLRFAELGSKGPDPRVNQVGEVCPRDLQVCMAAFGVCAVVHERCINVLIRLGVVELTPVGSVDRNLTCGDLVKLSPERLPPLKGPPNHAVRFSKSAFRLDEARCLTQPGLARLAILGWLRAAEVPLDKRLHRMPRIKHLSAVDSPADSLGYAKRGLEVSRLAMLIATIFLDTSDRGSIPSDPVAWIRRLELLIDSLRLDGNRKVRIRESFCSVLLQQFPAVADDVYELLASGAIHLRKGPQIVVKGEETDHLVIMRMGEAPVIAVSQDNPSLDGKSADLLICLHKKHPLLQSVEDLAADADFSSRLVRERINWLISAGLVERPRGHKGGCGLTERGQRIAAELRALYPHGTAPKLPPNER